MYHKGLNQDMVLEQAVRLIEQDGMEAFSMHRLAETLGVRTASLYKHCAGAEELRTQVGLYALREHRAAQFQAIQGKERDQAVTDLALAYRGFAKEHRALYRTILEIPAAQDQALQQAAETVTEPILAALSGYALGEREKMHWQRVLRGMMHGFIAQEEAGYFSHFPVDPEESYRVAIQCLLSGLHAAEGRSAQ